MRTTLAALAVAALLALGAGGVAAATADTPQADAPTDVLPANHTVEVVGDDLSDETRDRAIRTAWANDTVSSHFADGDPVHFEVWPSQNGSIRVMLAPGQHPNETRVVATVDADQWAVTSVSEPITLAAINVTDVNESDVEVNVTSVRTDGDDDRNATRHTADQSRQFRIVELTTDRENGTTVFEASTDGTESSATAETDAGA